MGEPRNYRAIMLSSTFTDLSEYRQRAIEAISKLDYMPKVMEHTGARADDDVIESSLNMVRDSTAYVGVISLKYGQMPFDPDRNPGRPSITELEFNEAMQLDRPIVLFVMGDEHPDARGSGAPPPAANGLHYEALSLPGFCFPYSGQFSPHQASERRMTWRRVPARAIALKPALSNRLTKPMKR